MFEALIRETLQELADRDGVSVEYVRNEIQKEIDKGFDNPDPEIQARWKEIPYTGARPTPDDVILYMAIKLKMDEY